MEYQNSTNLFDLLLVIQYALDFLAAEHYHILVNIGLDQSYSFSKFYCISLNVLNLNVFDFKEFEMDFLLKSYY